MDFEGYLAGHLGHMTDISGVKSKGKFGINTEEQNVCDHVYV